MPRLTRLGAWSRYPRPWVSTLLFARFYLIAGAFVYANLLTSLLELLLWLQPPPASDAPAAAGDAAADGLLGCAGGGGGMMTYGYLAAMFAIFWFLIISPQRKQAKAQEAVLKGLKKGDIVRTTGGIRGEILSLDEREVTLKVAEKIKLNVLRSHVSGPDAPTDAMPRTDAGKKD